MDKLIFNRGSIYECKFGNNHQVIVIWTGHKSVTFLSIDGTGREILPHWKFDLFYRNIGAIL